MIGLNDGERDSRVVSVVDQNAEGPDSLPGGGGAAVMEFARGEGA